MTDRQATGGRALSTVIERALEGIADSGLPGDQVAVQLREKDLATRDLTEVARVLRGITAAASVRFYVNDRLDVAIAVGADGVHLGGGSLPTREVRQLLPVLAIGVSTHGLGDVQREVGQATFAVFGPIRDTPSKRGYGPPLGFESLAAATTAELPLLAIGGIEVADVPTVIAAGAHGVACIRPVMAAEDPKLAVRALARAIASSPVRPPYRT
ncbi:MAG TPA: thiamine phosphate synthase [Polyangia bacterium]|nr:thiamine phosphate synthase [Polyangia bacterium]